MFLKLILVAIISVNVLTACFHDDTDSTSSNNNAINILAVSGKMVEFTGTFTRLCDSQSAGSEQNTVRISDDQWSNIWRSYDSTDCSGTVASTEEYKGTLTTGATGAITGWVNGNDDSVSAPVSANTTGSLSDTESYTILSVKLTVVPSDSDSQGPAVGDSRNIFYIVDDTGTGLVLFDDQDLSSGQTAAVSENPLYSSTALPSKSDTNNKINITSISGSSIELTGTFTMQCDMGTQNRIAITGNEWTYTHSTYIDSSADCSGTPNESDSWVGTITSGATKNITGWDSIPAPTKADSSGVISNDEVYTPLTITFSTIPSTDPDTKVGDTLDVFYVVDDSGTGLVLYPNSNLASMNINTASSDNAYYSEDAVIPENTGKPDLQIVIDSTINTGFEVNITYTVTNVGDADAGEFSIMLWTNRSETQQPDYASNQCCGFETITSLAAGASVSRTMTGLGGGTWFAGDTYHVYMIADFFKEIVEADEGVTGTNDNLGHLAWVAQ